MATKTTGPTCLVCKLPATDVFRKVGKFTYYRCSNCGGVFVYPLQPQSFYLNTETYLTDANYYVHHNVDAAGVRWMVEQFERLYQQKLQLETKGSLFEVGTGTGYLTLFAYARGWQAKGIETSQSAVQFARETLKADVSLSTIETFKAKEKYDAIMMVEVLEHFVDPLKAVGSMMKLTTDHTFLFGTTPNTDSQHWTTSKQNIYVPEDHIFLFNDQSLRRFAEKAGIKDLTIEYFGSGKDHDSNLMYCGIISESFPVSAQ